MHASAMEKFFFRPEPKSMSALVAQRRESSSDFQTPPVRRENKPYHLDLATLLPQRTQAIQEAGQIVFHAVGDTGGINGTGAQQNVADHMTRQIHDTSLPEQPSFFYHLGDVVYSYGEESRYHDQFYQPYQDYPAPIFAIPGNHDGKVGEGSTHSLEAFMDHFCARVAHHAVQAGHSVRPTMIQPNCFWRLEAPFVTIIGLYSNVSGELDNTDAGATEQREWLTAELRTAPTDKCLLLAVHHPMYSLGSHAPAERVQAALEQAMRDAGRVPDAVLSGHDHSYQRFTRVREGREIPYLIVGGGGTAGYHLARVHTSRTLPADVSLEAHNDKHPGFLRITIDAKKLVGEYFTVPDPGQENEPEKRKDKFTLNWKSHKMR